ncbi:MAG: D-hexose-6-phosphate mutarotase [Saccharospirillaceae bacterium]|nr:D-hexose-6-phosphate mutarotase [Pseudomonadales bacterium]NRB80077.1 D-hexose-6-phosphate mutarotase [Saccharospirillaceae bacterium]
MNKQQLVNKNATLTVYEYGAHVTSWVSQSGKERLFISQKAIFEKPNAIRGGIPIIFPQFNERGPIVRHGFARNMDWQVVRQSESKIVFELLSNAQTKLLWPYHFKALYKIELNEHDVVLSLTIRNTDNKPFSFTAALHSYFRVEHLTDSYIQGLTHLKYWDNNGSDFNDDKVELNKSLTFKDAIDRVYFKLNSALKFNNGFETLNIQHEGFEDCVIWNPGKQDAKNMKDFDDTEYNEMLCIEAAQIVNPIELKPNDIWTGTQIISEN